MHLKFRSQTRRLLRIRKRKCCHRYNDMNSRETDAQTLSCYSHYTNRAENIQLLQISYNGYKRCKRTQLDLVVCRLCNQSQWHGRLRCNENQGQFWCSRRFNFKMYRNRGELEERFTEKKMLKILALFCEFSCFSR